MNTRICYLYRDASNYKKYNEAVIAGELSPADQETILDCLSDEEYFIPRQVGLPENRFGIITNDDHCWFELMPGFAELCDFEPTVALDAAQLVTNFKAAKDAWDDTVEL